MKKIILAISNEDVYKFLPETEYDVILATDAADGNEQLERIYRNLSAVLVDIEFASENDFKFLSDFKSDLRFSFMPALVIKKGRLSAKEAKAFEHGAVDAIDTSDVKEVCVKRLESHRDVLLTLLTLLGFKSAKDLIKKVELVDGLEPPTC